MSEVSGCWPVKIKVTCTSVHRSSYTPSPEAKERCPTIKAHPEQNSVQIEVDAYFYKDQVVYEENATKSVAGGYFYDKQEVVVSDKTPAQCMDDLSRAFRDIFRNIRSHIEAESVTEVGSDRG